MADPQVRLIEVQYTHEFSGATPVWDDAPVVALDPGQTAVSFPALGQTKYAVRQREVDVYGNASAWSTATEHTTLTGPDSVAVTNSAATVVINDDGITIYDGALILEDEFGQTVMVASGFSGSWAAFMSHGLYNGNFAAGIIGSLSEGRTSDLPYWSVNRGDISGTVTISRITDALYPGGTAVRFKPGGVNDYVILQSDRVSISGLTTFMARLVMGYTIGGGSDPTVTITANFYDADGTYLSGLDDVHNIDSALLTSAGYGLTSPGLFSQTVFNVPAKAAQARLQVLIDYDTTHHASTEFYVGSVGFLPDELGYAALASRYGDDDAGPSRVTFPNGIEVESEGMHLITAGGTIYFTPGDITFPATSGGGGERFFRSDLKMWFYHDGTRWLSEQLFVLPFPQVDNLAATSADVIRIPSPQFQHGAADIWLQDMVVSGFNVAGGTALGASHRWSYNARSLNTSASFTALATYNINSGASSVWRLGASTTIEALLGTDKVLISLSIVKTGTPGNLFIYGYITYRLVFT